MIQLKGGVPDLVAIGKENLRNVYRNFPKPKLYEEIIRNKEGQIAYMGPIVVRTGHANERELDDRFIVKEPESEKNVCWGEKVSSISEEKYESLLLRLLSYLQNKEVYVQNCFTCYGSEYQTPIRIITETAWHSLYARNMYTPIYNQERPEEFDPSFSVIHIPGFQSIPEIDGTKTQAFVIIHIGHKLVVVGGTHYAGEIRQAVFTMLNYILPNKNLLPMRCSANMGDDGDVAIFLGRKGTGKTTLAIDESRQFIGDHIHGWGERGIFNFECGSYAKIFNISPKNEKAIFDSTRQFGTILENVSINFETRRIDLNDGGLTDNTRACFSDEILPFNAGKGIFNHPKNLFLLTIDAFGVLPPIAKLTPDQAVYAFLSSYSSELNKTENGIIEPSFNVCFGDSSLTFEPHVYAKIFHEKILNHKVKCWLVNTGWIGEPYGKVDQIKLSITRDIIRAAIKGKLDNVEFENDPLFKFDIPLTCPGVPTEMLNPRNIAKNKGEYEIRANRLASEFINDFTKFQEFMPGSMGDILSHVLTMDNDLNFDELGFSM